MICHGIFRAAVFPQRLPQRPSKRKRSCPPLTWASRARRRPLSLLAVSVVLAGLLAAACTGPLQIHIVGAGRSLPGAAGSRLGSPAGTVPGSSSTSAAPGSGTPGPGTPGSGSSSPADPGQGGGQSGLTGIHKIQHVIIIMQENRSFDSYFGTYPGVDGIPTRSEFSQMPEPRTAQVLQLGRQVRLVG